MEKRKSICLVTSEESFLNNYGAALQGFALNHILKDLGFDVFVLKYRGGMKKPFKLLTPKKKVRRILSNFYHIGENLIHSAKIIFTKKEKQQFLKFKEFYDTSFVFVNSERVSWFQIQNIKYDFDIFVCGSDQIWNPYFKNGQNDLGYFLDFVSDNKLKISYAPSFGCFDLPELSKQNIKSLLEKIDYISVREKTGAEIIKKYSGIEAKVVLDPTMLLSGKEWEKILKIDEQPSNDYILVYRFSDNPKMKVYVSKIAELNSLNIIVIPLSSVSKKYDKDWKAAYETGPREFVKLIRGAKLICTDSFHATVFSLLFNRPFLVFERENYDSTGNNMNSRIHDLLSCAKMKDRIISNYNLFNSNVFNTDFTFFNEYIQEKRVESKKWLNYAVNDYGRKKD